MPRKLQPPIDSRDRYQKPAKRGKSSKKSKGLGSSRTKSPLRNGLLIIIFSAILILLVVLLPKEPTRPAATLLAPKTAASGTDGDVIGDSVVEVEVVPLRISEVMASNKDAYPDDHGNYSDWIEIENTSETAYNIESIGLSDRDDRILFLFPNIDLPAGGRIIVFCDDSNVADKGKPLHARFKISALGETLYLFGRDAVPVDMVEVPPINSDVSYALTQEGWVTTEKFTPGYPNTDAGFDAFRSEAVISADGLVLNEIVASNRTTIQDEDGDFSDWIELYNGGTLPIDLSNYALSDDEGDLVKWRFPHGATIKPGEFYLVFASGKDRTGGDGTHPHTNFKLAAEGETVVLSDILRQVIDRTTYDNLAQDSSWGRIEGLDNSWQVYLQPTPGLPNTRNGELEMDRRMVARNTSGIYISEVLASSSGVKVPDYGTTSYDWIEIVNNNAHDVDISNWGLSDKISRPRKWQFAEGTILAPGQHLLVFPSGYPKSPMGSDAIHATFRLSAMGESLVLSDPQGNIIDKLVYPKLEQNNSFGRNFDHGGLFYYEVPTPGALNTSQGFAGYATMPTISTPGGVFTKSLTVTLSAPSNVRVRYTTDGSNPTETNGLDYTGPIEITDATPLRARGFVDGYKPSDIATETYLINVYHSLPIIALTVDPDELYNEETGMLAEDEELKATYTKPPFKGLTYWKKLPHPGNFEYFTTDGKQMLNQGVELQLNGQYSMDQAQKSIRVSARARYGYGTLAYPFFSDRDFTEYQAVILRNGGQDGKYTRIIDALQSKIIDWTGADIMHMASTPVIAFINGEYWGQYNLRERINKHSIAAYEGWKDPEQIDFIKGENKVISGTYSNYKELREFVSKADLNDPEQLKRLTDWIDVDNYFDFMIFQIYFGNTDAGNIKFYREKPNGKWRWVLFDLDWGYFDSSRDGCYVWLKPEGAGEQRFDNSIIRGLLSVPEMRDRFLTRYGFLFQEYFSDTDRIRAQADEMLATIQPELLLHFNRWAGLTSPIISEEPTSPEGLEKYWSDRVSRMHNVLKKRPNLAWGHVKEFFELTDEEMIGYFGPQPEMPADAQ